MKYALKSYLHDEVIKELYEKGFNDLCDKDKLIVAEMPGIAIILEVLDAKEPKYSMIILEKWGVCLTDTIKIKYIDCATTSEELKALKKYPLSAQIKEHLDNKIFLLNIETISKTISELNGKH